MINLSRILTIVGFFLLLMTVVLKLAGAVCNVGSINIRHISLLVIVNTCFILAILFKK